MSIWVSLFIADFINNFVMSTVFLDENQKYIFQNSKKMKMKYFLTILFIVISCGFLFKSNSNEIKTIIKILISGILFKTLFKEKMSKIFMKILLTYVVFLIYDTIFGLVYLGILKIPMSVFNSNAKYILLGNLCIAIVTYITLHIKSINNFIENICKWTSEKDAINLFVNIIMFVVALWFFINRNANGVSSLYEYIVNFGIISIIIVFVIGFYKENSDKNQLKKDYDSLISYAKVYEQEVVEKSKWQHEYENQLIVIKDKISNQNKEAHKYIDQLLENRPVDENSQWLEKLSKFPDVGIKGLLCYKIGQMQTKGINVYVDVIEDIKIKKTHSQLLEKNLQDISRILGVYIDNAIDASSKATKKYFIFEVNLNYDSIVFQISNTFLGSIDLQKIGSEKYSTKGHGHGYGLSLVRDILEKNSSLKQEREINGMYYVQKLIVNTKK